MIKIEILNGDKTIKHGKNDYEEHTQPMEAQGVSMTFLATQDLEYVDGDFIRITTDKPNAHLVVKLDETLNSTLVYLTGTTWEYVIPLSEGARPSISDLAFKGKSHYISARYAEDYEINQTRNLAFNPHDQKQVSGAYPHAIANIETRNDSTFFAKNAIDGVYANNSHGSYPYQSWGINRDPNAQLTIEFGRKVSVNSIGLVFRADFPHDSFWTNVSIEFSCGIVHKFDTIKAVEIQKFKFDEIETEYVIFKNLIKADDESPFPALSQIEVYGREV